MSRSRMAYPCVAVVPQHRFNEAGGIALLPDAPASTYAGAECSAPVAVSAQRYRQLTGARAPAP